MAGVTLAQEAAKLEIIPVLLATRGWSSIAATTVGHWNNTNSFIFVTDNSSVAHGMMGRAGHKNGTRELTGQWDKLQKVLGKRSPRSIHCDPVAWTPRSLTAGPDLIRNVCMDSESSFYWIGPHQNKFEDYAWRFVGDGAYRQPTGV